MLYLSQISRFVVALIFLYSFATKLRDFAAFKATVGNFQLLPNSLYRPAAVAFMLGEAAIVISALLGGNWLFFSFSLAIFLLAIFIYALNSVLRRKIQTTCNCFGASAEKVSPYDIWRNLGIILMALLGLLGLVFSTGSPSSLDLVLCLLIAAILSLLLLNLRQILELLAS